MAVGGSVRDHMVDGNTNKDSVDELRCLTRQQRELVAVVSDGLVVVEKRLNDQRYIRRSKNVRHPQIDGCLDESCTGAFLVIQEDDQRRWSQTDNFAPVSRPLVLERWIPPGSDPILTLPFTHEHEFIDIPNPPLLRQRILHFSADTLSKLKARVNSEQERINAEPKVKHDQGLHLAGSFCRRVAVRGCGDGGGSYDGGGCAHVLGVVMVVVVVVMVVGVHMCWVWWWWWW
ncbi:hypothetical protein OSB04_005908 [Centaurea solstitialis]|uniref:Uncharacterized protein n=1 Tax=Centaurea solstitialis TaxID=347529 RepID=A0AA38TPJ3_9ASTR|nr:hypothetical protein OSB04_005908 [Centaurea solstitialis]